MPHLNRGFEYREQLGAEAAGLQLLDYLCRQYRHSSREEWRARIESNLLLLQGNTAVPEVILSAGQLLIWRRPPWQEPQAPLHFAILYMDACLIGLAKPSGLPTIPGGGFLENTLLSRVKRIYPEADPLHRLGRGTSGVVLFARTAESRSRLSAAWRRSEVVKVYRALISGVPDRDDFAVDAPVGPVPHPILGSVYAVSFQGKPAHTRVRVLQRRAESSLVEVVIATGRPHQIRIHLAAAGHPLTGDTLYAPGGSPIEGTRALPGDTGYWLHSERLEFQHPEWGKWMEITCSPPPPLRVSLP
ncbi:MAG TPA: RluA family pseudouridine synthase [Acidobacteriota bacterium]